MKHDRDACPSEAERSLRRDEISSLDKWDFRARSLLLPVSLLFPNTFVGRVNT